MQPTSRKILLFGVQFLPVFLLLVWLYPSLLPGYNRALAAVANPLTRMLSTPLTVEPTETGGWRIFRHDRGDVPLPVFSIPRQSLEQIRINIVLLPPLLLATPVPPLQRLKLLGLGVALLFALQLAVHVLFVWAWVRYKHADPTSSVYNVITLIHSSAGQVFPVVLWGLLTWRHWLPGGGADDGDDRADRPK